LAEIREIFCPKRKQVGMEDRSAVLPLRCEKVTVT
jgi:hypothetical protein